MQVLGSRNHWGSLGGLVVSMIVWGFFVLPVLAELTPAAQTDYPAIIQRAVAEGKLCFRLTTSEDIKALLGPPVKETTQPDGGMEKLSLEYNNVKLSFMRMQDRDVPFTLLFVSVNGSGVDIGQGRQITLRHAEDLKKFDPFWGFSNVSLANVDLRDHLTLLQSMPFDSRTVWPSEDRLPSGFDPTRVFEQGKNPGLGVRALHKQGIDGQGIGIAIIDQPLVRDHPEYADRIKQYEGIDVTGVPPQMHGPGVASIAVGKQCGVAPGANLYYYAVPMWKWRECQPYADIIHKILQFNEGAKPADRIRIVSISTGMFPRWEDFEIWKATLESAEQQGVMVLTCSTTTVRYLPARRSCGKDPEDPNSYVSGIPGVGVGPILVPAGNRTTASHEGSDNFAYWTEPGMSWATPYLAGLAALACQVDARISPSRIFSLWQQTAVKTETGSVVNPTDFMARVKASRTEN